MTTITIKSNIRNYPVIFDNSYERIQQAMKKEHTVAIIDKNVYEIYKKQFENSIEPSQSLLLTANEENKSLMFATEIYKFLLKIEAKRNLHIVTIGGGITQDIVGFVASTLYRGVNWSFFPTTLLAQTDSCIGSKTSINFENHKNIIGTFYPPNEIIINTLFINSLSKLDFASGIGEIIKFQLMSTPWNRSSFLHIRDVVEQCHAKGTALHETIYKNLEFKRSVMEEDEFDLGRRNLLNYGHCFGHAIEATSNYLIPHGIAVIIGILFANHLSGHRGLLNSDLIGFLDEFLLLPNIFIRCKEQYFEPSQVVRQLMNDKKRIGEGFAFIIPDETGKLFKVTDVLETEVRYVLDEVQGVLLA